MEWQDIFQKMLENYAKLIDLLSDIKIFLKTGHDENQKLIVEIHRLAHWKDDVVLEKLCTAMNLTETKFPDSNLTLNYKLVSS